MEVKLSTKKIMLSVIDECDFILREFLSVLTSNEENTNPIKLLDLLLDKDAELKSLIPKVNEQMKMQRYMDYLKSEIDKRDKMILSSQLHLRKSEIILNTAIYYARKKLTVISTAVANPVDPEEVIKYGHRITAGYGVVAPPDWCPGDKRRPFPTEENIRSGFLGHLDNVTGEWSPSLVEYASSQESRLNAVFGLAQPREGIQQPPPSPLQSPRVSQQINPNRTPQLQDTAVPHSSGGSLVQFPPGVNVVSSPSSNLGRPAMPLSCSTPSNFVPQSSVGTPSSDMHRNAAGSSSVPPRSSLQHAPDEVEVMTDSCSSSSSDGF